MNSWEVKSKLDHEQRHGSVSDPWTANRICVGGPLGLSSAVIFGTELSEKPTHADVSAEPKLASFFL